MFYVVATTQNKMKRERFHLCKCPSRHEFRRLHLSNDQLDTFTKRPQGQPIDIGPPENSQPI